MLKADMSPNLTALAPAGGTAPGAPPARPHGVEPSGDGAQWWEGLKHLPAPAHRATPPVLQTARPDYLPKAINAVVGRFVDPGLRPALETSGPELRLQEDLDLDSLTMMEICLRLEDVVGIRVGDDDLRQFRTLGDVHGYYGRKFTGKVALPPTPA
jgi:acyl carrier protein